MNPSPATPSPATPSAPQHGAPRANSPESLDGIIATTNPRGWWALWAIAGVVVAVLIWSIVATIPQQKTATGVVSPYAYSYDITATVAGVLTGDTDSVASDLDVLKEVKKGEQIATIVPYDGTAPVPVLAPVDGELAAIYISQGEGVEPGTTLGRMTSTPNASAQVALIAWVPFSTAFTINDGESAQVTVSDVTTGETVTVPATIEAIAQTPSSIESMTSLSGNADLAEQWSAQAGGQPYRVELSLDLSTWPKDSSYPAPGSVIDIVATYAEVHPIEMLFGGAS
jgi:hypothetical protein